MMMMMMRDHCCHRHRCQWVFLDRVDMARRMPWPWWLFSIVVFCFFFALCFAFCFVCWNLSVGLALALAWIQRLRVSNLSSSMLGLKVGINVGWKVGEYVGDIAKVCVANNEECTRRDVENYTCQALNKHAKKLIYGDKVGLGDWSL